MQYSSLNKRQVLPFLFKNPLVLVALICVVTLLRNGISIYGTLFRSLTQEEIDGAYSAWPGAYTLEFINQIARNKGLLGFLFLYLSFLCLFVGALLWELKFVSVKSRICTLLVISLLPGITVIFQRIGTVDTLPILIGILGVLSRSSVRSIVYSVLTVGVHPEAAVISGVSLLLVLRIGRNVWQYSNARAVKSFAISMVILGFLAIFYSNFISPHQDSRISVTISTYLKFALIQNLASSYWIVFGWFGTLWIIVYLRWVELNISDKRWFVTLLFSVGGISLLAFDGTRVATILLTPMIVLLSSPFNSSQVFQHINFKWWIVMYFVPPLNISNFNIFLPFHQILYVFDIAKFYVVTNF
jgi:hypothetical protein